MKKRPLFSIITPTRNQADFIEETIKSVLAQTGDFSIEYIIADGVSSDGTLEIIKKYEELLKNGDYPLELKSVDFKWWSRPDKGQPDAINKGFRAARGEIVAWINSDDIYEKGAFSEVAAAFRKNPGSGMIYGNYSEIDSRGKIVRPMKVMPFDLHTEIDAGNIIPTPSTFFKRQAVIDAGYINPRYQYAFDYDLFIKVAKLYPVVYVDKYWSKFRLHESSKTVSMEKKFWPEEREISRAHGAQFFSRHLINHYSRYYPRTMFIVIKSVRLVRLLIRGRIVTIFKKVMNNIRHAAKAVW